MVTEFELCSEFLQTVNSNQETGLTHGRPVEFFGVFQFGKIWVGQRHPKRSRNPKKSPEPEP